MPHTTPHLVHYTLTPDTHRHIFAVRLSISGDFEDGVQVFMPNWIAGSYMLREFARHIVWLRAFNDLGEPIELSPTSQHSWHSAPFVGGLTIEYEVFAHDNSVRAAFLDTTTGFFNATSVCLCVQELADQMHTLMLHPPVTAQKWQVATQLTPATDTPERGFGEYTAKDYDELADCPVRMGVLNWLTFEAEQIAHTVAISGDVPHLNATLLIEDMRAICTAHLNLFAPTDSNEHNAPFDSYLFLIDARATGYGGLEHRSSTALLTTRTSLPNLDDNAHTRRKAYTDLLGLISHEYFHTWNVKRIKPAAFVPYDLTEPTDTSLLWFFEGVTSYYDDLILYRTGILDETQYFKVLEQHIHQVMQRSGAQQQTVTQAGYYAWSKYYQPTENTPNSHVSYYTKGALIALCLDLFIRHNSQHTHSLDDVMRSLWHTFGRDFYELSADKRRGVQLADIQKHIEQFTPISVYHLLHVALLTTQPLPLNLLLVAHGLHLKYTRPTQPEFGASFKKTEQGWLVERVFTNGMAQRASLAPQDILIAINGHAISEKPDDSLRDWKHTRRLTAHYWRDGVLQTTTLNNTITPAQIGTYRLERTDRTTPSTWPLATS